jgi:UDP-N-acetylglucosamine---dolichyl-phosphate N-acetylglucosaminyltransferase
MKPVAVIVPAKNEGGIIRQVLSRIPRQIDGMDVISVVVDDGSTDRTAEIAREAGAYVLRHLTNLGVGAATRTGLTAALALDAGIIVTMDADGQHDPSEIERLVRCLREGPFDVVIGSRLLAPKGMPMTRFAANLLLNAVTFVTYRKIVSDSQSGFKAFSRSAAEKLELHSSGYEICSEIVGEIYRKELSYKSLPVKVVYTEYSHAKGQHFLNGVNLLVELFIRLVRRV